MKPSFSKAAVFAGTVLLSQTGITSRPFNSLIVYVVKNVTPVGAVVSTSIGLASIFIGPPSTLFVIETTGADPEYVRLLALSVKIS